MTSRLSAWAYTGEDLEQPEDVFKDKLNYTLRSWADVVRLNGEIPPVAKQFRRLADIEENRDDIRKFLSNLERIQVAVGELEELTKDKEDPLSNDPRVEEGMREVVSGFEKVTMPPCSSRLPFSMAMPSAGRHHRDPWSKRGSAPSRSRRLLFSENNTIYQHFSLSSQYLLYFDEVFPTCDNCDTCLHLARRGDFCLTSTTWYHSCSSPNFVRRSLCTGRAGSRFPYRKAWKGGTTVPSFFFARYTNKCKMRRD